MAKCAYAPCERPAITMGYCGGHYQQYRAGKEFKPLQSRKGYDPERKCGFPGCTRPHHTKGWCDGHYQQQRAGRSVERMTPLQESHDHCTVPGCGRAHEARGYCTTHYSQWRQYGAIHAPIKNAPSKINLIGDSAEPGRALHAEVELYGRGEDGRFGAVVGYALINLSDVSVVGAHRWRVRDGYAVTKISRRQVLMHRLLVPTQEKEEQEIDHINGDRLDNRRENLRVVTHAQNAQNHGVRSDSTVGVRGVNYDPRKRLYRAFATVDGMKYYAGRFKTLEDAELAASALREKLMSHTNEDRRRDQKDKDIAP